ncbi:MAG: hypothetical protein ACPIOQ_60835, partial [Promethearchaeia archaeon]
MSGSEPRERVAADCRRTGVRGDLTAEATASCGRPATGVVGTTAAAPADAAAGCIEAAAGAKMPEDTPP